MGRRTRPSLGGRLALAIGSAVGVVILMTAILVSVGVVGRFDAYLDDLRAGRHAEVASLAADLVEERGSLALRRPDLRRLAVIAGGPLEVRDPNGDVVASITELPGVPTRRADDAGPNRVAVPIVVDGATVGTLEISPLASAGDVSAASPDAFREAATLVVLIAGIVAVLASMVVAFVVARRLTRPIGELATAARRIEAGDLAVRVPLPSDAESQDLAVAFNEMAARLERSERLRRRTAADLAHEIATPVTVVTGRLQALADGVITPDPDTLAVTRDAAEEVRRLVGDLQDLADAEGASLRRAVSRTDLRTIAVRSAAASQALFDECQVELRLGGVDDGPPVMVDVDERQIERAIANLLTNAAVHTPAGGWTTVAVSGDGPDAIVTVTDSGPGITAEDLPHVFERLYRGDPNRRPIGRPPGTGIGLTVARQLIEANGGRVGVESTSPDGTTFALALPRVDSRSR